MASNANELPQVQIDMTPMIDVVFNLLIFFMLVNQMVQIERAELQLPLADQAKEGIVVDQKELILNIHKDGRIEVSGRFMNWNELSRLLFDESRLSRDSQDNSNRSVLIRGDIDAPYKLIQKVMIECAKQKIYKISFGARLSPGK